MKPKNMFPAALFAAIAATPAMACTDWKAIAAFDAVIAANDVTVAKDDQSSIEGLDLRHRQPNPSEVLLVNHKLADEAVARQHYADVLGERESALADKCQENAQ